MNCFENIIALKEQCTIKTGLYINSLGINESMLNDIITSEHSSANEFLKEMTDFAVKQVKSSMYSAILPYLKSNSILEEGHVGDVKDNKVTVNGTNGAYKGVYLNLTTINGYFGLNIAKGALFTNHTGSVSLDIIDITKGIILDSINVNLVAGENVEFSIKKTYFNNKRNLKIFVGYDSTNIQSYKTTTSGDCAGCKGSSRVGSNYISSTSKQLPVSSSLTISSLSSSSDTGGLQLDYSIQCDQESWMYTYTNLLATPILYKTAYQIMEYALTNRTRVNYTKIDTDWMKDRKEEFDFEFNRHLKSVLSNIQIPNDRYCFICNNSVKHATMLP